MVSMSPPQPGQPLPGQPMIPGQPAIPGQMMPVQPVPGMAIPGQPGMPGAITGQPGAFPSTIPGGIPGARGFAPGQPMIPGTPAPGAASSGSNSSFGSVSNSFGSGSPTPTTPGMPVQPGQAIYPGQPLPGQPGAPVNSQTGGVSPYSTFPGSNGRAPGIAQPGLNTGGQNQQATDLINRILTSPRPGGMPTGAQTLGGATLGGGIAGFASKSEGEGIMSYNDHTLFEEWEFVFDPAKQKQIPNPNVSGVGGTPAERLGNTPTGMPGNPVQPNPNTPNPFTPVPPPRVR